MKRQTTNNLSWPSGYMRCKEVVDVRTGINRTLVIEILLKIFSYLDVLSLCRCAQVCKLWNILALDAEAWQSVDLYEQRRSLGDAEIDEISFRCGRFLKQISVRECQRISVSSLGLLMENCNNIEALNLSSCNQVNDRVCSRIGSNCPRLKKLDLSNCTFITDLGFLTISYGCRNLESIDISVCKMLTDSSVSMIAQYCLKITEFIAHDSGITDKGIKELSSNCTGLKRLNLAGCPYIGDPGVISISSNCPGLIYLCLADCPGITDEALEQLGRGCRALRFLDVADDPEISDDGVDKLTRGCRELQDVNMAGCTISDMAVKFLVNRSSNLYSLNLGGCQLITDYSLLCIANSRYAHRQLAVLHLDRCTYVTNFGLKHLHRCSGLQWLRLGGSCLVNSSGIRALENQLPNLSVHVFFPSRGSLHFTNAPRLQGSCQCCVVQ